MDKKTNEPELKIYYEPMVQPSFSKIIGYEAQAKLSEKGLGQIPQNLFFPIAEKAGLGLTLGKWLFEEICVLVNKIMNKGLEFEYISIAALGSQLRKKSFPNDLKKIIEKTGAMPEKICFEINEDFFNLKLDATIDKVFEIKDAGFKVIINNYSGAYLPLSKLNNVPIDAVKLAPSITDRVAIDEKAAEDIASIIKQLKNLEIEVLAVSVENREQQLSLMELHCQKMQGPLYGKPLGSREVLNPKQIESK